MTHVVSEACIGCKYTDCVEICPVDCFVAAIYRDHELPPDQLHMIALNAELVMLPGWKPITRLQPALPDAELWKDRKDKLSHLQR